MRYRLVTDGKDYGVERYILVLGFFRMTQVHRGMVDLNDLSCIWWPGSRWYNDCWGTREKAEAALNQLRGRSFRPVEED